jgi:hypothetical protein
LGAVFAALLVFYDPGTDEPVAKDEGLVDGGGSAAQELIAGAADGLDELVVFHGLA